MRADTHEAPAPGPVVSDRPADINLTEPAPSPGGARQPLPSPRGKGEEHGFESKAAGR
jgi:hypothetical protein